VPDLRGRALRAKRGNLFTCQRIDVTLTGTSVDEAGQAVVDLGLLFATKSGRSLQNVTLVHTWISGWWSQAVAATSPLWRSYTLAVVRANVGMDTGDFLELEEHTGDISLFDCRALLESEGTDDVLFPRTEHRAGAGVFLESRGMRKIDRVGDTIWLVVQKDGVTEQAIVGRFAVTMLWKLP